MAKQTQTIIRIPAKKRSVLSTDIIGGGAYTTYTENGVVRRSFVGGGGRASKDVRVLFEQEQARKIEANRLAEIERQKQIEKQRKLDEEAKKTAEDRARENLEKREALEYQQEKDVAFRQRLADASRSKRRGLSPSEREDIRESVYGKKVKFDVQRAKAVEDYLNKRTKEAIKQREVIEDRKLTEPEKKTIKDRIFSGQRQLLVTGVLPRQDITSDIFEKKLRERAIKVREIITKRETLKQIIKPPVRISPFQLPKKVKERQAEFLLGVLGTGAETLALASDLFFTPGETIGGIVTGAKTLATSPTARKEIITSVVTFAKKEPFEFAGRVAGELALLKASSVAIKKVANVTRLARTKASLKYVPVEDDIIKLSRVGKADIPFAPPMSELKTPIKKLIEVQGKTVRAVSMQTEATLFGKLFKAKGLRFGTLKRELFFDPAGRLRVSRGLSQASREASLKEILTGKFELFKGKGLALVEEKALVEILPKDILTTIRHGKVLTPKQLARFQKIRTTPTGKFKPTPKLTTEPEIILPAGEFIVKGKEIAKTIIFKEPVSLAEFKIGTLSQRLIQLQSKLKQGIISKLETKQLISGLIKETGQSKGVVKSFISSQKKIASLSDDISKLQSKAIKGTATKSELAQLNKKLRIVQSSTGKPLPFLPVGRQVSSLVSRALIRKPVSPRVSKPPVSKPKVSTDLLTPRVSFPTSKPIKQPKSPKFILPDISIPISKPPSSPGTIQKSISKAVSTPAILRDISPTISRPPISIFGFKKSIKKPTKKPGQGYDVFVKVLKPKKGKPKFRKTNIKALDIDDARDMRNYLVDTSLTRRGEIRPTKGKPGTQQLNIPKNYAKITKDKFRLFRQIEKKRYALKKEQIIEKGKHLLDTRQEVNKINLAKRLSQLKQKAKERSVLNFVQ